MSDLNRFTADSTNLVKTLLGEDNILYRQKYTTLDQNFFISNAPMAFTSNSCLAAAIHQEGGRSFV